MLAESIRWAEGSLLMPDGQQLLSDLRDAHTQQVLQQHLGRARGCVVIHGGFFLGPQAFTNACAN